MDQSIGNRLDPVVPSALAVAALVLFGLLLVAGAGVAAAAAVSIVVLAAATGLAGQSAGRSAGLGLDAGPVAILGAGQSE